MPKQKRIDQGLLIKHPPFICLTELTPFRTIFVSSSTPFVSALKRTLKTLDKINEKKLKRNYVSIVALGNSVDKALSVALKLQKDGHKIVVETSTKKAFDEVKSDKEEDNSFEQRLVSKVEIKVYAN